MPIERLPLNTVKTLGATQTVTDAASLVKELVDNALDARASSVVIELSQNAVDVIHVRDNGHGIAPEDRAMVARRYCTSKLRNLEDLRDVGSRWLGFRGEALASAAELAGEMLVTTRVDGEEVASTLKVDRNGELAG